ncbi:anaerobic ribonucleoside-triphosphate reductase activating protein [Leptobacterium flavescens]|uniref:Anaerobic ribonucleoside-triphosphate reductase activating protein n=1 Tax=Leptobacterium flavescens TaxID=472055 RepID=A0A6P0UNZ2_9FLAO|nr:anaerobic ribonucleoside-triphosphate reductase activating protein [Leptobacterium flavescens]NER14697.1 anaerobic ribonucleoside-triphosphate reductase activating protein [Leptobacterium flavescens]
MYCYSFQIALQEVPGEISLCFSISGCPLQCKGCHSPFLWKEGNGRLLSSEWFESVLEQYDNLASCVLFMGGEWHKEELVRLLKLARKKSYKTCLYTGEDRVPEEIRDQLTWIKTGKWVPSLGGLDSKVTNQRFTEVETNKTLNHLFIKNQNL